MFDKERLIKGNKLIDDKRNIASNYIDISFLYGKTNNKKLAIKHLLKVDSMYQKNKEIIKHAHEANETLYKDYSQYFDIEQRLQIVNKLLTLDSILKKQRAVLHNQIIKKYETPQLLLEKDTLITQLENKRRKNQIGFFMLILLSLAFLIFLTTTFQKNRRYKKRFQILLENSPSKISKKGHVQASLSEIPQDLVEDILQRLETFEKKQRFVKKKYTLESLARELKTNSSYLSKIINATKNTNFSTYINTLRIDYAVECLKKDTLFRTYTIEGIAEVCGFNTSQAFSTAFYKQTGIYPAYFIKQLHKQNPLEN